MLPSSRSLALLVIALTAGSTVHAQSDAARTRALREVDAQQEALVRLSDSVWRFAETALKETRSAALLADHAEQAGFRVTRGVAGMPTAFVAEFGSGSPVIGVLGEYDALPGISQKAQPTREALEDGAPGHGCGHNLFGAASLGAAIAIKRLIEDGTLRGTVKFFGTPAEEAVGGKVYMARDGIFDGVDVMLAWHPDTRTRADTASSQALVDLTVEFTGRSAHAAADPWNGPSAADAAEAFVHGINLLREHVRPTVRMHYVIQHAGDVPNVIPEHARVWLWVRDRTFAGVETVLARYATSRRAPPSSPASRAASSRRAATMRFSSTWPAPGCSIATCARSARSSTRTKNRPSPASSSARPASSRKGWTAGCSRSKARSSRAAPPTSAT